jgi:hypothetical protein
MNRVLPHKRVGLLQELMWDDQKSSAPLDDIPGCVAAKHALDFGSMLKPVRKRVRQWSTCLACDEAPTKNPADFRSDSEQMNSAIESASLDQLQAAYIRRIIANRRSEDRLMSGSGDLPIVAIVTGTSTRGQGDGYNEPGDIPFWQRASQDTWHMGSEAGRFEFWIVLAIDSDDPYYGLAANRDDVRAYFLSKIAAPLKLLGVLVSLSLLPFDNMSHKPGPAFNVAAAAAYTDGADFLFRINDDTVLVDGWASALVAALASNEHPFVGVAGPRCSSNRANADILTHDFVHRTHLDIFPTYYPVVLADWWMDDWITHVYGNEHTCITTDLSVGHLTAASRYEVQMNHACFLEPLVQEGRLRVGAYFAGRRQPQRNPRKRRGMSVPLIASFCRPEKILTDCWSFGPRSAIGDINYFHGCKPRISAYLCFRFSHIHIEPSHDVGSMALQRTRMRLRFGLCFLNIKSYEVDVLCTK